MNNKEIIRDVNHSPENQPGIYSNWLSINGKKIYFDRLCVGAPLINNRYVIVELRPDSYESPTAPDSCLHCYDKDANLLWIAESPKYPDGTPALPNYYDTCRGIDHERELIRYYNFSVTNTQSFAGPHIPFYPKEPENLQNYILDAKTGKILYARDDSYRLNRNLTGFYETALYYWYSFKDERFVCFPRNFKFFSY
jgi:hypothetical protein